MSIYIPFTYIIGWSNHKKFYYGAKWAKGCQPSDLWVTYFTSSNHVKEFREEFGEPDIIKIHRTFSDKESCILFESSFLQKINVKELPQFLNQGNGSGKNFFKKTVSNKEKNKIKNTTLQKYGVDSVSKLEHIKEKKKETSLKHWGVECSLQSPIVREKGKQTCLIIYGTESHNSSPIVIQKKKETFIENWGVEHYAKVKRHCSFCGEYKSVRHEHKCPLNPNRKTNNISGENNPNAITYIIFSPDNEEFTIKTKKNLKIFAKNNNLDINLLIKNGIEGWKISIKKRKNPFMEKYGVDNPSKIPFFSLIENKETYSKIELNRTYPEFKSYY